MRPFEYHILSFFFCFLIPPRRPISQDGSVVTWSTPFTGSRQLHLFLHLPNGLRKFNLASHYRPLLVVLCFLLFFSFFVCSFFSSVSSADDKWARLPFSRPISHKFWWVLSFGKSSPAFFFSLAFVGFLLVFFLLFFFSFSLSGRRRSLYGRVRVRYRLPSGVLPSFIGLKDSEHLALKGETITHTRTEHWVWLIEYANRGANQVRCRSRRWIRRHVTPAESRHWWSAAPSRLRPACQCRFSFVSLFFLHWPASVVSMWIRTNSEQYWSALATRSVADLLRKLCSSIFENPERIATKHRTLGGLRAIKQSTVSWAWDSVVFFFRCCPMTS